MQQRFLDAGVELVEFDFKRAPVSQFFRLIALMRKRRPDIVQTWMYHADMFGGVAARLAGNRNVIWGIRASELTAGDGRATLAVRKLCAWLSRWVPHTIVCVAEAARRVHVTQGYDASRMVVIPNGFELSRLVATTEERASLRTQCGIAESDVVVGTLGRFNLSKDQNNFIQAAGMLAPLHPRVRFLMVGRDLDANNAEVMDWISRTGYAHRFVLLGERADAPSCLAAMDVFCLSSRAEGFPNVVGEAMSLGVPCIVTDVGDAAMLVADTGLIVPKENPSALAAGLARLLAMSPDERWQMGQKAKARVKTEYASERTRERFEALYQNLRSRSEA